MAQAVLVVALEQGVVPWPELFRTGHPQGKERPGRSLPLPSGTPPHPRVILLLGQAPLPGEDEQTQCGGIPPPRDCGQEARAGAHPTRPLRARGSAVLQRRRPSPRSTRVFQGGRPHWSPGLLRGRTWGPAGRLRPLQPQFSSSGSVWSSHFGPAGDASGGATLTRPSAQARRGVRGSESRPCAGSVSLGIPTHPRECPEAAQRGLGTYRGYGVWGRVLASRRTSAPTPSARGWPDEFGCGTPTRGESRTRAPRPSEHPAGLAVAPKSPRKSSQEDRARAAPEPEGRGRGLLRFID